jgi:DNA replication protein DnaD
MSKGWISIHRTITKHWVYQNPDYFRSWIDILLEVNHEDGKLLIGSNVFLCKRGESLKSLDTWAKRWRWHKSKVRRFLKLLEKDGMIAVKSEHITTRITVCKYDDYQDIRNKDETGLKHERNGSETGVTPNNKENKENKEKEPPKNSSKKVLDDPEQVRALKEKFPGVDVCAEIEKMKDWFLANGKRQKDYIAFARNWLRKASPAKNGSPSGIVVKETKPYE